ncbi:NADP-dependent oxidoreductase [Orlajensenia leifsoniae]|uniref:NADP-dependent oxidoreductase n=1 Tax=Orlajensenia leifsoniae TaxID=2561933 RepID=UPI001F00A6A7|nr:NADP-dependent oxidoreductase [Leifsonia flava]
MPESIPETMRALVVDRLGAVDELRLADVAVPLRIADEVLVRVVAASVNPIDVKTRSGRGSSAAISSFPFIGGSDFSGVVAAVPYAQHPFPVGTPVFGMGRVPRVGGSFAEFVTVASTALAVKPATLSHVEAAAVPVAAQTAWGMVQLAGIGAGDRVLVHAGAGGVGHFAVQFAAIAGAHVVATASAANAGFLRELGAQETIDYASQRFEDVVSDIDVVIDLIGNVHDHTGTRSLEVLREGGRLVNAPTGSWPTMQADAAARGIRATGYNVPADGRVLAEIAALLESGAVTVHVDSEFDLEDGADAQRAVEGGHVRGKVVIRVAEEPTL